MSLLDDFVAALEQGKEAISAAATSDALEKVRVEYLGRSGKLRDLMARIKEVAKEEKGAVGQKMNEVKDALTGLLENRTGELASSAPSGPLPDPTLPGITQRRGTRHPLTQTVDRIAAIFERLGFSIADGPEVEDEFHNFDALNIPENHPARDSFDTFFLSNDKILRSQTSTVQIRVMEKIAPPVRIIAPGRVYRPDTVDATHFYGFSQLEGLAVGEDITFADLKGTLGVFAREMFGKDTATRFRPHFFPFTEPSAEMDVSCIFCQGQGCKVCKRSGWIEILGCGMVDPNVFLAVNKKRGTDDYDPEKYSGFAFGLGIERIAMLTLGVDDIRRFFENDLRFLRQF
jgi:phenylalanyl-tRNA synthetase alpha chain